MCVMRWIRKEAYYQGWAGLILMLIVAVLFVLTLLGMALDFYRDVFVSH